MIGIYKITNKINGKAYIGQSVDILKRWSRHKSNINNILHEEAIYCAMRKYSIENFTFEVIEECEAEQLDSREIYWISYYNTMTPNGYNMTAGGNAGCARENLLKANEKRKIPVLAYDLEGNFYKEFDCINTASKETGVHSFVLRECLIGKNKRGGEYQWRIKESDNFPLTINKYAKSKNKRSRTINQYDLEGKLLNTFPSILEASNQTGVSRRSIKRVLDGEYPSTKGFIFMEVENGASSNMC